MAFFAWTGEDFDGWNRTIQWFRQALPTGPQVDLLRKEIPRYCKKQVCKQGEIWAITLVSTGFHFADEYGEGKIVRPVGFTPAFQKNAGWDDNLTINPPRCILAAEKLHILTCSQMIHPLFMYFQTAIFFAISRAFSTPLYLRRKLP
jgi:hypothetical protein